MKKIILILASLSLFATNAHAYLVKGFNIEELSSRSTSIFMGEVLSVSPSPVITNGIPYIEVKFKVFETYKGSLPSTYTYHQFAPKVGKQFELIGMERGSYVVGNKLVVFLGGPSSAGFSAPIGFQLFKLLTKSNDQKDLDKAIIVNRQFGEKAVDDHLFKNLQKKKTMEIEQEIRSKNKDSKSEFSNMNLGDLKKLIRASVE